MSTTPGMSPPLPPAPPADKPSRRGCIIAVVVALLLVIVGCMGACFMVARNPGRMLAWAFEKQRGMVISMIAADAPPEKRQAFEEESAALIEWARGGIQPGTDPTTLRAPLDYLNTAAADKTITADEIDQFVQLSRKARGADSP